MKHIDSLHDFIISTLNVDDLKYLITKLSFSIDKAQVLQVENPLEVIQIIDTHQIEFLTQSKRVIRLSLIKQKLLVQKPKILQKLKNVIRQVGQGEGGFSDQSIESIIAALVKDEILIINTDESINWSR